MYTVQHVNQQQQQQQQQKTENNTRTHTPLKNQNDTIDCGLSRWLQASFCNHKFIY